MWTVQVIRQPWGVSAFGSSLVQATPDLALLRFSVVQLADKPAAAFKKAHEAAARVRNCLKAGGVPDAAVQTSRVGLEQSFEFVGGGARRFVGYSARVSFRVRVNQLDSVEKLLVELVDAGANQIDAVEFLSSQLRELRAQARRLAVVAAKKKAENYAQAAGAKLGALLHIEDVNPDDLGRGGHGPNIDLSQHSEEAPEALPPGSITIAAAVMVGYAIQHE